jgi:hypothetical protein
MLTRRSAYTAFPAICWYGIQRLKWAWVRSPQFNLPTDVLSNTNSRTNKCSGCQRNTAEGSGRKFPVLLRDSNTLVDSGGRLRRGSWCPGAGWPTTSTNLAISITYRAVDIRLCTTILCQFNPSYSAIQARPAPSKNALRRFCFDARKRHLIGMIKCQLRPIRPLFGFSPNPRKIFSVVRMSDGNKPLGTLFNCLPLKLGYSKLRNHRVRIGTRGCHKAT